MPSLISFLLSRRIPTFTEASRKQHHCVADSAVKRHKEAQKQEQLRNVETVFQAIADGHADNQAMQDATGLSKTTCFNSCGALLKAERVTLDSTRRPYTYYVKEK